MLNLKGEDEDRIGEVLVRNDKGRSSFNNQQITNALNSYNSHLAKTQIGHRKSKVKAVLFYLIILLTLWH